MSARTLVVVNPSSRSGTTRRRFAGVEAKLREALGPLEVEWTGAPRDAERIAREGVRSGIERIVVAGGDGTTSEVVTGLLAADLGRYAQIAILPLGTGGDLIRTLGVSREIDRAVAAIAGGSSRSIDAGRVTYRDREGAERTSYFVNVTSLGVSGLVTELVNRTSKAFGGSASFLVGTLRGLARYRTPEVKLELDGETIHAGPLVLATAANGRYFGGGMKVAPEAQLDDGLLDVVVVPGFSKARLVRELPRIYRGTHLFVEGVLSRRGRCLEASAEPGSVWLELDGEPLGTLPARVEILPGALSVVGCSA